MSSNKRCFIIPKISLAEKYASNSQNWRTDSGPVTLLECFLITRCSRLMHPARLLPVVFACQALHISDDVLLSSPVKCFSYCITRRSIFLQQRWWGVTLCRPPLCRLFNCVIVTLHAIIVRRSHEAFVSAAAAVSLSSCMWWAQRAIHRQLRHTTLYIIQELSSQQCVCVCVCAVSSSRQQLPVCIGKDS